MCSLMCDALVQVAKRPDEKAEQEQIPAIAPEKGRKSKKRKKMAR